MENSAKFDKEIAEGLEAMQSVQYSKKYIPRKRNEVPKKMKSQEYQRVVTPAFIYGS